jgi:hypothetical protein
MAADVDEQGGVVDDRAFRLAETDQVGHAERNQALAQHVLQRLAEPEADSE